MSLAHVSPARRIRLSFKRPCLFLIVSFMAGLGSRPAAQTTLLLPAIELRTISAGFTGDTWPADFNNDGITDLVGNTSAGLAVALGNGNGSFAAPVASAPSANVLTIGDVNSDGFPDVVAENGTQLLIVPGTGSAVLGAPSVIRDDSLFTFATVADMDNDGTRDLVVGQEGSSLHVFPGTGGLTFGPPFTFATAAWPHGHIVADLDNDGLRDIVVAHRYEWRVTLFRNGGAFAFNPVDLPIGHSSTDVAARDLNGDAALDLIVSARRGDDAPWDQGLVYVYLGNGDGSFRAPATFSTALGTQSVVVGDFTRDGQIDIVTTNRSFRYVDSSCSSSWGVDSVSLLAGRGDGTFAPSIDFALGPAVAWDDAYQNVVGTLNTSDLNGDGHPDLITSRGKILLNAAPRANRPPVVLAGDDQTVYNTSSAYVRGRAEDPDHHLLRVNWSPDAPAEGDGPVETCLDVPTGSGEYQFYLTASDGHGGVTSDDLAVTQVNTEEWPEVYLGQPAYGATITAGVPFELDWYAFDEDGLARIDVFFSADGGGTYEPIDGCTELPGSATSCTWNDPGPPTDRARIRVRVIDVRGDQGEAVTEFVIEEGDPGTLETPWTSSDVGAVGAEGSASYDVESGTFTVRGSGADIWGTADEFHWMHQEFAGDFDMTARVLDVEHIDAWTKAGLMVREGTGAGARHASLFVTPTTQKGIAFQRRPSAGRASLHTSGPAVTAPVWIRLKRTGDTISAYWSATGARESWTAIGRQAFTSLSHTLEIGFAVGSHRDGLIAAATFELTVVNTQLWWTHDIGDVGVPGAVDYSGYPQTVGVQGSGADIWGKADAFTFHNTAWTLDGSVTTRVRSLEGTNAWAKAGVMFRETLAPGSKHVMLVVSPGKGIAMQYRSATAGSSSNVVIQPGAAPEWLRLTRTGSRFTGYASEDGLSWRTIGAVTIDMSGDTYVGLPVTSHDNARLTTAVFEEFSAK